jgi:hypothetical protein
MSPAAGSCGKSGVASRILAVKLSVFLLKSHSGSFPCGGFDCVGLLVVVIETGRWQVSSLCEALHPVSAEFGRPKAQEGTNTFARQFSHVSHLGLVSGLRRRVKKFCRFLTSPALQDGSLPTDRPNLTASLTSQPI